MAIEITKANAKKLWILGNNDGRGFAPYTDVPGADTVDAAVAAAIEDGWTVEYSAETGDDLTVLRNEDGEWLAIGNAHGPWAIEISEPSLMRSLQH